MNSFIVNKSADFASAVKTIVRQSFPAANPSPAVMNVTEKGMRGVSGAFTSRIAGSRRERFTWGNSRIGGSYLVG
jgi:hypothetical protein